jgi:hypothetical protein
VNLAAALDTALRELTANPPVEVRENGGCISPLTNFSWEVRGASDKPLLHLWSSDHNLTRRVLAIAGHSGERLTLSVERFGRRKPSRMEFVRVEYAPTATEASRASFNQEFRRILAEQFPDETLETFTNAADLGHSLSENYLRGTLRRGSVCWAWLAAAPGESSATIENGLTFALLWLDRCRTSVRRGNVAGVRLIIPKSGMRLIAQRAAALRADLSVEIYEFDSAAETLSKIEPRSAGNVKSWIVPQRQAQALLDRATPGLASIVGLAPEKISVHASVPSAEVWLRFRGLSFACWDDGRVFFGVGKSRTELTTASEPALKKLIRQLEAHRHSHAQDTRHPLFRAKPEGWLECAVREDITRIDACLDPRFVYTQVFANLGGEQGILDLLAVTRTGRLAILELKASEHIHLPLQAAGYWQHVRHHMQQDSFSAAGFFPGIELQAAAPLVYLVAPAMHFHPTTGDLLRHLSPEMHVTRIGLDENWRRGLRVVLRQ